MTRSLHPVILCGGSGTRLWPLSRELYPKQFLSLDGGATLLQQTLLRVRGPGFAPAVAICHEAHRFVAAEQVTAVAGEELQIIAEPEARGTAFALAVATEVVTKRDPDAVVVAMPSDHRVEDERAFIEAITRAAAAVMEGGIALLGVKPTRAETGYGYIERGEALADHPGVYRVAGFIEKPDAGSAARMLEGGGHLWNSGIFVFRAGALAQLMEAHAPLILEGACRAVAGARAEGPLLRLPMEPLAEVPVASFDRAVVEKAEGTVVVPVQMGWNDLGTWSSLWESGSKDELGNVALGDALAIEAHNCYLRSDGRLLAAVGVDDLVIVATNDAVVAVPRDKAQEVSSVVAALKARTRQESQHHTRVYRPWGFYESLNLGPRFQVKLIEVKPGAALSLQKHHHRAEHWVVVSGSAQVTIDSESFLLTEGRSTFIDIGRVHRLENPGRIPCQIIEVQTGSYLGEDDIVRLRDVYGRVDAGSGERKETAAAPKAELVPAGGPSDR